MRRRYTKEYYSLRVMSCMAFALLLLVLSVRFWPPEGTPKPLDIVYDTEQSIQIDEIVPTTQQRRTPPPPAPLPPIVVPDDAIIDEELALEMDPLSTTGPEIDTMPPELEGPQNSGVKASHAAKLVRFATPEYPRAADRRNVRAEVVVSVVVDSKGRVQSPRIVELYLLDERSGIRTPVDALGYGLEEAALSAADRSLFQPARQDGIAVRSNNRLVFKFGV